MRFIKLYIVLFIGLLSLQSVAQVEKDSIIISKEHISITFTNKMKNSDLEKIKQDLLGIDTQLTYYYLEFDDNKFLKRIYARILFQDKTSESIYIYEITEDTPMSIEKGTSTKDNKPDVTKGQTQSKSELNKTQATIKKVDFGPIFPGCEKKKTESRINECFKMKTLKFVKKNFNNSIAGNLNLSLGKKMIYIMFTVDKNGNVFQIKSSASHIQLEKEAIRVVGILPKMIPGKLNGKAVSVNYSLPISLIVQ